MRTAKASAAQPWAHLSPRRQAWLAFHIVVLIIGGLTLDRAWGWTGQHAATVWTLAVLAWVWRIGTALERKTLILCITIAGAGEAVLSLGWGLYDYQFGNLPWFVPPGHALLMTLGLLVAPSLKPSAVFVVTLPALAYGVWAAAAGFDRFGVVLLLAYLACVCLGPSKRLYAAMFALALAMELFGTALGNWAWRPMAPGLGLTQTNPPFSAGAFYCVLDLLVLAALRLWPSPGLPLPQEGD